MDLKKSEIKKKIESLIKYGTKSSEIKDFIEICKKIAIFHLSNSRFLTEVIYKSGLSIEDISYDCIAELFLVSEDKYKKIEEFFRWIYNSNGLDEEEITAKLIVLVRSNVNQRISEIRGEYGDIFFKVRKSIEIYIERGKNIRKKAFRDSLYVCMTDDKFLDFDLGEIPSKELLDLLFEKKMEHYFTPNIVNTIFDILENQDKYVKALRNINLYNVVVEFYMRRYKDYIYS